MRKTSPSFWELFFGIKFHHIWAQFFCFCGALFFRVFYSLESIFGLFSRHFWVRNSRAMIFCFVTNFSKIRNVRIKKEHSVINLSVSYRKTSLSSWEMAFGTKFDSILTQAFFIQFGQVFTTVLSVNTKSLFSWWLIEWWCYFTSENWRKERGKKKAKEIAVLLDLQKWQFFSCKNIFYTLEETGFVKFLSKKNS